MSLRRRGGRRNNVETAELNITAFMNLMVILVPFLLITAVFSRLAILELNLPGSSTEPVDPQDQTFQLEVIVRTDRIEVGDRNQGLLGRYPNTVDGYDYEAVETKLVERLSDFRLVRAGKVHALRLLAVAKRGVEKVEAFAGHRSASSNSG